MEKDWEIFRSKTTFYLSIIRIERVENDLKWWYCDDDVLDMKKKTQFRSRTEIFVQIQSYFLLISIYVSSGSILW